MNNKIKKEWLSKITDTKIKEEIESMSDAKIAKFFDKPGKFGTAGIRGEMEWGPGGMNIFTIQRAALAYADFLLLEDKSNASKGIIIGHDNRHKNIEFTETVAAVFQGKGFKVYLPKNNELKPTPYISYCVNHLKAAGGVIITASHNPPQYNGFKVYDHGGAQLLPEKTNKISELMAEESNYFNTDLNMDETKIKYIDEDVENLYIDEIIKSLQFHPELEKKASITFSSMHGTSFRFLERLFQKMNYKFEYVKEQAVYDPNFSATKNPNPEIRSSFELAAKYSDESNSDLVIITDPDADRIGVAFRHEGKLIYYSFNILAGILLDYYYSNLKRVNRLPKNPYVTSTYVSGTFFDTIARDNGLIVKETLSGFKWVGHLLNEEEKEKNGKLDFVMGYEEAFGCVLVPTTRDKDSIQAACLFADMVNYYLNKGKTLKNIMDDLGEKYGTFADEQRVKFFEGPTLMDDMNEYVNKLRETPPTKIGSMNVIKMVDFKEPIFELGRDNLLMFWFDKYSFVAVRPSGTEPKIKVYASIKGKTYKDAQAKVQEALNHFIK